MPLREDTERSGQAVSVLVPVLGAEIALLAVFSAVTTVRTVSWWRTAGPLSYPGARLDFALLVLSRVPSTMVEVLPYACFLGLTLGLRAALATDGGTSASVRRRLAGAAAGPIILSFFLASFFAPWASAWAESQATYMGYANQAYKLTPERHFSRRTFDHQSRESRDAAELVRMIVSGDARRSGLPSYLRAWEELQFQIAVPTRVMLYTFLALSLGVLLSRRLVVLHVLAALSLCALEDVLSGVVVLLWKWGNPIGPLIWTGPCVLLVVAVAGTAAAACRLKRVL